MIAGKNKILTLKFKKYRNEKENNFWNGNMLVRNGNDV
jgi:hypothetical protein